MAIVLARLRVSDYDKWREVFESKADLRKSYGCNGTHIFYNAKDKNDVIINFQWDTEENATRFQQSEDIQKALQEGGVVGQPEFTFLEDGGRTPS